MVLLLGASLPLGARLGFRLELGPAAEPQTVELLTAPTPAPEPTMTPRPVPTPPDQLLAASPPTPPALPTGRGAALSLPSPSPSPIASLGCSVSEKFVGLVQALGEERVGWCQDDDAANLTTSDSIQRTTRGLLVWDSKQGVAAFTDGSTTWYGCSAGIQRRSTDQAFPC